jgi:hemolysin activation/secretion protein
MAFTTLAVEEEQQAVNYVDAGRVEQQVRSNAPPQTKSSVKTEVSQAPEPKTKEAKIHFKLTKVTFIGNTVFSQRELQKIFDPSLGKDISLETLQKLVRDVSVKYRTAGYILSRAILPPQVIKGGAVKVQVVEGFISQVTLKGKTASVKPLLEAYGKHIMQQRPLNVSTLERYALLANDLPGVAVKMVINPSKDVQGGADLTFVTTETPINAYATYDDYGTRYIGPLEASLGTSFNSIFVPGDSNSIRFAATTRPHELQYVDVSHIQPWGSNGTHWLLDTNYSETKPGFVLTPSDIVGRNYVFMGDLSYPWIRSRNSNISFHTGFNYQNVVSTLGGLPFYDDRIRSLTIGATYDKMDSYRGINTASLDIVHGFDILGAADHVNQSRIRGHSQYYREVFGLSRLQAINPRFSVFVAIKGQYTWQALLATEQFGIGGPDFGRGYDPSEIVGDKGVAGKIELRMDTAPDYAFLHSVQYYAFYDAGIIWNIDQIDLPPNQSLTSTGVGARFSFIPQLSGNFFIAKPLSRQVSVFEVLHQNTTQMRTFFQIAATFP